MAEKTTNYNLTKPSSEDFYDVKVHNDNMDIIDSELKNINNNIGAADEKIEILEGDTKDLSDKLNTSRSNLISHLAAPNPHNITPSTIGLGDVPNVPTNDQTPTYTEASTLATLTSGEKLSVAFGKIKKAISDFISHIANTTMHITSSERTTWNGKAPSSHASSATTYGVGTTTNYGHLKITDSVDSEASGTAASAKALKTVNESTVNGAWKLFKEINVTMSGSASTPTSVPVPGLTEADFDELKIVVEGNIDGSLTGNMSNNGSAWITFGNNYNAHYSIATASAKSGNYGDTWNGGQFIAKKTFTRQLTSSSSPDSGIVEKDILFTAVANSTEAMSTDGVALWLISSHPSIQANPFIQIDFNVFS